MKREINVLFKEKEFFLNEDDFQSLNSKGFGLKLGNIYSLNIYEALYLLERGKINILNLKNNRLNFDFLLKKLKVNFNKFLVFKSLKSKGYYVGTGLKFGCDFRVYNKGDKINSSHSKWLVRVYSEKDNFKAFDLASNGRVAHSTKKIFLFAIVDLEGQVSFFENSWLKL